MKDVTIFGDMTLANLFQDIYVGTMQKRNRINKLITLMEGMMSSVDDISVIGPILTGTLDVLIKNDDNLIKIATVVQRLLAAEGGSTLEDILSDEEKDRLTKQVKEEKEKLATEALSLMKDEIVNLDKKLAELPLPVKQDGSNS